jgi:hypothetical protein
MFTSRLFRSRWIAGFHQNWRPRLCVQDRYTEFQYDTVDIESSKELKTATPVIFFFI